jgi:hypothetical protein
MFPLSTSNSQKMDSDLIYWLLFRAVIAFAFVEAFHASMLRRRSGRSRLQNRKRVVDAPGGLPVLGHALSFSSDMSGFSLRLK